MNTPIYDFVKQYASSDISRFHMPGHKGVKLLGPEPYDITEIVGADSLYTAHGIIEESENNASLLFDTAHTFYSTEGSTLAIKAMLAIATSGGGKRPLVLASRGAHKAFVHAAALLDLRVKWIYPEMSDHPCSAAVTAAEVEAAFVGVRRPSAVYITSPDYLGNISDISAIAKVCHEHGVPLLVDNAHGAYLKFLQKNLHPIALGADMCCDSAHKTLPVLTGGAYLHISKNAPSEYCEIARSKLSLFASTSPSYLILQSLDLCNRYLSEGYRKRLADCVKRVDIIKDKIKNVDYFPNKCEPLKLVINTANHGYKGWHLAKLLRKRKIEAEYADDDYIVFMASPCNKGDDFGRLIAAFALIFPDTPIPQSLTAPPHSEQVMSIREAVLAPHEVVDVNLAIGRICGTPTVSCPPAVPIVVSGERITREAVRLFKKIGLDKIEVVKE